MFLSDISIRRPVFATMMMVTLVVLGIVAYQRLSLDEYPDVTYPVIIVQTSYPGTSPEVMERQISRPIEQAVNTVQGIYEVSSTSLEGISIVRLQFNLGADVKGAQQDVQAKVSGIRRQLPPDVDEPIVRHFDPNDSPIISIAAQSTERPLREITDMADETIVTRLQAVPGVGAVNRTGGSERVIRVQVDPAALNSYRVSPQQVMQALQRENQEVPAGRVDYGEIERLVRVTGRVIEPRQFANIVVAVRNGVPIRISDVGTVIDGEADKRTAAEIDRNPAVSIEVLKISGANTVDVADSVRAAVADLQRQLPSDVTLRVTKDDSRRIRESLLDVQVSLVLGAILTIAIIYLFLNSWRSTVITGLALPISIISAFFIMWVMDFTINTMTLLALSLAIGLLIDDAIVVRENIVRHMEMGKDHYTAARDGTSEIGLAVFSTTLAVVAVFVPVAFMGGMIGKIFFQFGVTVAFAVLVSLFVSFTLDPMLSSVWYDPDVEHGVKADKAHGEAHAPRRVRSPVRRVAIAFNNWFERMSDHYPAALRWALHHRPVVMVVAVASIVAAGVIIPRLGFTWMPDANSDDFSVGFRTAPGSTLDYTLGKGREISDFLKKHPDVEYTYLTAGGGFRGTPNQGSVNVQLRPHDQRERTLTEIQNELRGQLRQITGVSASINQTSSIFGGRGQPIRVNIQGPEQSRLKIAAGRVYEEMKTIPGVAEPTSSDQGDIPQLDVSVDRQLAWAAGVGINAVGTTLQPLFSGTRATRWEDPQGYQHDVIVVYPDSLRKSAADVANIPISSTNLDANGQPAIVPLSQVADVRSGVGPQQIERRQLERQINISAGVIPGYPLGDVAAAVKASIDSLGLPPGYHAVFTGDVQNLNDTKGYVAEALILAVVFIYLILASLFGSFLQPLAIMLALPLSFIGVALALLLTKGNMNVMSMIGIIMLMGLVTKNGILLVDFTNQQREHGGEREAAILTAARTRIRPIIMTTVAMVFGMIPLALALGAGAEQRAPMARAVIGGLVTSTLLTLFVVPVMYTLLDDAASWALSRRRSHRPVAPADPAVTDGAFGD
jgi:hydrophobic/amphiphilic exporter-1 (mainly G- bacteria), HAE1 family